MQKVLFLITEKESANGICVNSITNELINYGCEVFCITNRELGEKEQFEKGGIKYLTVKPRECYKLQKKVESISKGFKRKFYKCAFVLLNNLKNIISIPKWPLLSNSYQNRIYKSALKVCREKGIDTIVAVYSQIDTLISASKVKIKIPQIKYVAYMLDSLAGGYGPKVFSKKWVQHRGLKWEQKVFYNVDKIIMMKSAQEFYQDRKHLVYFNKIVFLDLPLFIPRERTFQEQGKIINFLYVGTIPVHIRNPKYFINCFMRIMDDNIRFKIIGTSTCEDYLKDCEKKDGRIQVLPFISHDDIVKEIEKANFLINLGNNNKSMTPSKIFEYMSYGKPIISTAPIEDEPSIKYLEKYPLSCVIYENEDIETNINKLKNFIYYKISERVDAFNLLNDFYLNTPKAFIECLSNENN